MTRTRRSGTRVRLTAVVLSITLAMGAASLIGTPSHASSAKKAVVARAFVSAMADHDLRAARKLVKSSNAAERKALLNWNDIWTHATTASCRGALCFPQPWRAAPGAALHMRQIKGRWWVTGIVGFPTLGPGRVVGTGALYDATKGKRAHYGPSQGTTYWKLVERDSYDAAYARVKRDGDKVRIVVRVPGVVRLHAPIVACSKGTMRRGGMYSGRNANATLPFDGYVQRSRVTSPVWRWGRTLELWDAVDFSGWGSELQSRSWARSTATKTGGSHWKTAQTTCGKAT